MRVPPAPAQHPDPDQPPDPAARRRLIRLRAEVGALEAADGMPAGRAAPSTTAHWMAGRRRLREAVLADDPGALLTWPVVRDTMLVAGERHPYLDAEVEVLRADRAWDERWAPATVEDPVGSPPPLPGLPQASGNRVHHAYQFRHLERTAGVAVQDLTGVVEFGGGYGAMCVVAHRLGFRGTYTVFDLPEWSALQRWYVGEVGLPVGERPGVQVVSDEDDLRTAIAGSGPADLFVAMWSLSETPLELRERLLPGGEGFGAWLFGYQAGFEGIDNVAWFEDFRRRRPEVDWSGGEPEDVSGNRYLVGRRRT